MPRVSSWLVVLTILSSSGIASARSLAGSLTCDAAQLRADSYRLTTEVQALNLTRPRTTWWDAFDLTLSRSRDALADLNDGALAIAERAREIDDRNLLAHAQIARQLVILGVDGDRARTGIRRVFDAGGAIVWTATLYDVYARDYFLLAFDAGGIRVYRWGAAVDPVVRHLGVPEFPGPEAVRLWRALGGCLDGLQHEAVVAWADVYEIKAGNYVLYFKFREPIRVSSDRGRSKTLRELKVALHGAMGTVEYRVSDWDRHGAPSVTGIGIGPTSYQDRIRRTLAAVIDPLGRIRLPKAKRGAGW